MIVAHPYSGMFFYIKKKVNAMTWMNLTPITEDRILYGQNLPKSVETERLVVAEWLGSGS